MPEEILCIPRGMGAMDHCRTKRFKEAHHGRRKLSTHAELVHTSTSSHVVSNAALMHDWLGRSPRKNCKSDLDDQT